jgi:hypothetical protein
MNIRSTSQLALPLSLLSLALAWSGGATAQADLNTRTLNDPKVRMQSCAQVDIAWNLELIAQYPRIPEACHEVVTNNGTKWARFEANFLRVNGDGSVTSEFVNTDDRPIGRYTLVPGPDQQVTLDGRERPFSSLVANQRISLYVPEGSAELTSEPFLMPNQQSRLVRYEEDALDSERMEATRTPQPMQVASAEPPAREQRMTQLPDTAGSLPWFALGGLLSAFAALVLRVTRRA